MFRMHRQAMLKTMAEKGVHPGEAFCLRLIGRNDGISQRDLADILHLSRPQVTKILQTLEKKGEVSRLPDEKDHRLTHVFLTTAGTSQEEELNATMDEYINKTMGAIPKADRLELARLLDELADRISERLHVEEEPER
jgi:MarR family transcriptional regulator, organic hydroperoxide resistance regulator